MHINIIRLGNLPQIKSVVLINQSCHSGAKFSLSHQPNRLILLLYTSYSPLNIYNKACPKAKVNLFFEKGRIFFKLSIISRYLPILILKKDAAKISFATSFTAILFHDGGGHVSPFVQSNMPGLRQTFPHGCDVR